TLQRIGPEPQRAPRPQSRHPTVKQQPSCALCSLWFQKLAPPFERSTLHACQNRCSFQRTRSIEGVSLQRLGIAVVGGSVWTTPALMTLEPEIEASRTLVDVSV